MITKFDKYPTLITSNQRKLNEFRRFGLKFPVEKGVDIKEVQGTKDEVIIYKSLDTGPNKIVEDTIIEVNGEEVIEIKWKVREFNKNADIKWISSLGYNDGEYIRIYRGEIKGTTNPVSEEELDDFRFEVYFTPNGSDITMAELEKQELKDNFSARKIACEHLMNNEPIIEIKIKDIPEWVGQYQHQEK
jgi:inosine/xanthosine triphosphate pyrophosphatase family protein